MTLLANNVLLSISAVLHEDEWVHGISANRQITVFLNHDWWVNWFHLNPIIHACTLGDYDKTIPSFVSVALWSKQYITRKRIGTLETPKLLSNLVAAELQNSPSSSDTWVIIIRSGNSRVCTRWYVVTYTSICKILTVLSCTPSDRCRKLLLKFGIFKIASWAWMRGKLGHFFNCEVYVCARCNHYRYFLISHFTIRSVWGISPTWNWCSKICNEQIHVKYTPIWNKGIKSYYSKQASAASMLRPLHQV